MDEDVVNDRRGVGLPLGRLELDRIRSGLIDLEPPDELLRVGGRDLHRRGLALAELQVARPRRLVRPGADGDLRPLQRFDVPPLDVRPGRNAGVVRELVVERDGRDHRRGEDVQVVAQRLGVSTRQVVIHALPHVPHGVLPGVAVVAAGGEFLRGVKLTAVHAPVEHDLVGTGPHDLDQEWDVRAGDDLGQLGVVPRLDFLQPSVCRPDDIAQEGPHHRSGNAFLSEHRVAAEDHDHGREHIPDLDQPALVDDGVDLDRGQVLDRLLLDRRQERLRHLPALPAEVEVINQAVLERRVGLLDRPGRVEPVDPPEHRQDDPPDGERPAPRQAQEQDDPAEPDRQADQMVEQDFEEKDTQRRRDQRQGRGQDVGHLDLGPRPAELVVDELLVVEHLPVRLRAQSHRASSPDPTAATSIPPLYASERGKDQPSVPSAGRFSDDCPKTRAERIAPADSARAVFPWSRIAERRTKP